MSDNRDKPANHDPDATVTGFRGLTPPKADDDATVMMPSRKALEEPAPKSDDDATVMMTRDALKEPEPDEDATVSFAPGALKAEAAAEAAAAMGSPATPPVGMVSGPASSSARLAMMPCAAGAPPTSRWVLQLKLATAGMGSVPIEPTTRLGLYTRMSLEAWPIALEPSIRTWPVVR